MFENALIAQIRLHAKSLSGSLRETCEDRTRNVRLRLGSRVLVTPGIQVGRHLFDSQYIRIYSLKRSVECR